MTTVIQKSVFEGIADRIAKQHEILEMCVFDASSGQSLYQRVHCNQPCADESYFVETDLITPAFNSDLEFDDTDNLGAFFSAIINGLNSHVAIRGGVGITSMNDYLLVSGIKVHESYAKANNDVGASALKAKHVFRKDEIELGVISMTSSGIGTFTDGNRLNDGSDPDFVEDSQTAAAKLQYYVASGIGANDLILSVFGTNTDGNAVSATATIPDTAVIGDSAAISSTIEFADVSTVQLAGGDAGDVVTIRSIIERNIGL